MTWIAGECTDVDEWGPSACVSNRQPRSMKTGMGPAIRISMFEQRVGRTPSGRTGRCGSSSRAQTTSADEECEVPGDNPMLTGLAVAADGVVWFAMLHSGSLGRLQTAGSIFLGCPEMAHDRAALQSMPQAISGTRTSAAMWACCWCARPSRTQGTAPLRCACPILLGPLSGPAAGAVHW